jgi:uncharacterized cupin superfamily protein
MPNWNIVNVADAPAMEHEAAGASIRLIDEAQVTDLSVNIRVLQPGQPNGKYHSETVQEDFLVLAGECVAILDGEERLLRAWDFVHCPPGVAHVFVGAGDGPCAVLMVGARKPDRVYHYPVSELAARFGASPPAETADPREAYSDWKPGFRPVEVEWPVGGE